LLTYKIGETGVSKPELDIFASLLRRDFGISRAFLLITGTNYQSHNEDN